MSRTTSTGQRDLLSTQLNAEKSLNNSNSSEPLFTVETIENSPFVLIHYPEKGYSLGFMGVRISEWFKTQEDVNKHLTTHTFEIVAMMIVRILEERGLYKDDELPE